MKSVKHITVLLAEDHQIVREGLRKILEAEGDIEVVGEASTGRQAVLLAKKLCPAVVVMDIAMPLLNGIEATRQILNAAPETKVLILSAHSDDAYIEKVTAMGASGFLVKHTSAHALSDAIHEVAKGNTFFSPAVTKRLHKQSEMNRRGQLKPVEANLTGREMEVLQLIAEGHANKQTADELGITVKTVEKHRDHIMKKLNIHDTAGLTRYAIAQGVVECYVPLTLV